MREEGERIHMKNRIFDPRYGAGIIKNVEETEEGYWLTVLFDDESIGEKKFLSFVNPMNEKE